MPARQPHKAHSRLTTIVRPFIFLLVLPLLLLPHPALGSETIVLNITLNNDEKGEMFVQSTDDGDFLLRVEDLKSIGFQDPSGKETEIGGERYLSLRSLHGVTSHFNEKTLTLEIVASPTLLPVKVVDFSPGRQEKVYYPSDSSAFLNYGLSYATANGFGLNELAFTNQLGVRHRDFLFLTDSLYTKSSNEGRFVRLMSALSRDDRKELTRTVFGDFITTAGDLGSSVNMGGVSYSKLFRIDPYHIRYPAVNISGAVTTTSESQIFLDGQKVRTEKFSPGMFELRNVATYGGAGKVDIVLKDAFGREEHIIRPYYFSDAILEKGTHEYSYNLGLLRESFGAESNAYGKPALSAFHRFGKNDSLTLGANSEASSTFLNVSPQASYLQGTMGLFNLALGTSAGTSGFGFGGRFRYAYNNKRFGFRLMAGGFSMDYSTLAGELSGEKTKFEGGAGLSYGTREFGSLSLDYASVKKHSGQDRDITTVTYSRNIFKNVTLFALFQNIREETSDHRFLLSITYFPRHDMNAGARVEIGKQTNTEVLEYQKNTPVGEGYGYRASLERSSDPVASTYAFNPAFQYNGRYGVYNAEMRATSGGEDSFSSQLSAAGAIAYVGNAITLTRPIYDSFALVKVGELEGVTVYQNSQEIGHTDARGLLFVPNLNSFNENQITLNDKEIPMDFSLPAIKKFVSPPFRSGSCIVFPAVKVQPVTGTLHVNIDGETHPLEYLEVRVVIEGREVVIPTGKGGEFYLDTSQPAGKGGEAGHRELDCSALQKGEGISPRARRYSASVDYRGKSYAFELSIHDSDDIFIDLGRIVVNAAPNQGKTP